MPACALLVALVLAAVLPHPAAAQPLPDDPAVRMMDEAAGLNLLARFEGRPIGAVRLEALRFNGEVDEVREIRGYPNFIKGPRWLRQRILTREGFRLRIPEVRDDVRRLQHEGLFNLIRVLAEGGVGENDPLTLIYRLRSKPVAEIEVNPRELVTEGMASFKSRLSIREGEEYTEFKGDQDIKLVRQRRPNIAHVTIRLELIQNADGSYATGLRVKYVLVENEQLSRVEFEGIDGGKSEDDLRKRLETVRTRFYNLDHVSRDAQAIVDTYRAEGWYFCEVTHRVVETRLPDGRLERVLVFEIHEGPKVKVRNLEFRGLDLLVPESADKLFDMPNEWWDLWYAFALWLSNDQARQRPFRHELKGDEDFKPEELRRDLLRMQEILRGHGWLDARVFLERMSFTEDRSAVDLIWRFEPGPLYQVRSITIRGEFDAFTEDELYEGLEIREGMTYRRNDVEGRIGQQREGDQARMQRRFRDKGYYNAQVELQANVVPPGRVDLIYTITQNRRMRIGNLNIRGNDATKDSIIRSYISTRPGNWYSQTRIELDTIRLLRLGFFAQPPQPGVRIVPRPASDPFDGNDFVDIDVDVIEGDTGSFNLGVGWSSERGVVGFLQLTKKNFDLTSFPDFTGAGQELSLNVQPGPLSQTYSVRFIEPFFFKSRFSFTTSFAYINESFPDFDTLDWVVTGGFGYRLDDLLEDLVVGLTYKWNWSKAFNVSEDASPAIQEAVISKVYSSFRFHIDLDRRDDIFLPTRGFNFQTGIEVGGQYIGGNVNWWHLDARFSYTFSFPIPLLRSAFGAESSLSFRFAFDWQEPFGPTDSIPILKRVYLGGSATPRTPAMRGFALEGVGPRDDSGASLRGTARLVANIELRYPLQPGIIYLVGFVDIGQLQLQIQDLQSDHWNISWGFGLRLKLPISPAPLAIDFGFPLRSFEGDREQTVSFSLGFNF